MTFFKSPDRIIDIFLLIIFVISLSSFYFFRNHLLLYNDASAVLSGFLLLIFFSLLFQRSKLLKILNHFKIYWKNPYILWSSAFISLCFISLIIYSLVAIILSTTLLWQDEWNVFHRTIFSENLYKTIFSRYNHHPSYLINAMYAVVIKLLKSNVLWFHVINVGSILTIAYINFQVVRRNTNLHLRRIEKIVLASLAALFSFWILGASNVFWNVPYFQVLGAVLSIYGLSIQGTDGLRKGGSIFLIGALMISTSFGNGAVVWPLGIIASILLRQKVAYKLSYLIIGIAGSSITMGIFSISKGLAVPSDISTMLKAIPVYIGAAPMVVFTGLIEDQTLISTAFVTGSVALIIFMYLVFTLSRLKIKQIDPTVLFGILLGLFTVGCSILVIFGRMKNDISLMMAGRYTCWSALFWLSLIFLLIVWISKIKSLKTRSSAIILMAILGLTYITYNNVKMIESRLISHNIGIRSKINFIVNPEVEGSGTKASQPEIKLSTVDKRKLLVDQVFREKKQNIYSDPVTHKMGAKVNGQNIVPGTSFNAKVVMGRDNEGNYNLETYVENSPGSNIHHPHAIVITQDHIIIGIGYPYSDFYRVEYEKKSGITPLNNSIFLHDHFPGLSNYYFAQFAPLIGSNTQSLELFGFQNDKYIQIKF